MNLDIVLDWLAAKKEAFATLGVIVTISATVIGGFFALKRNKKSESVQAPVPAGYTSNGNQINAPMTASNGGVIKDIHIGDSHQHHYGLSFDDAYKLAEKLAAQKGEKDAQIIKILQETIESLTKQSTEKYNIQQALNSLVQGNTAEAEAIFANIAIEAKRKGKQATLEEAEALRHLGSLAFLHDTQKAFDAYQRSTELDPDNLDGWNQLGHLYRRIGELENSEKAYKTILKLAGADQTNQSVAYGNLGIGYQIRGYLDQAIEYHQKALKIDH
ncbi:MAG: tetratricopeptide repeat protein [Proteobacteria bacterium]|nr:tetratricopeptide repeat protein [Pseudomonadota bacterium]